jgi:hypothetical protein
MANQLAVSFCRKVFGAFNRFKIEDETKEIYTEKISRWRLNQNEWDIALDKLIEQHEDGKLPTISEITSILKSVVTIKSSGEDYGFMYFNIKQNSFAVRLVHRDNVWVSLKTGKFFNPPLDATDVLFVPDKGVVLNPHDMPSKEEVREYCREVEANMEKMR